VDSNPRVLNHLFFDDGEKPSAVPRVLVSGYQRHPEAPTTRDKRCMIIDHLSHFRGLRGA